MLRILILIFSSVFFLLSCATKDSDRYQTQVLSLAKQLKKERVENKTLRNQNLVLRQMAGVPEPAINKVKGESAKMLKLQSEKNLYKMVQKSFRAKHRQKLYRHTKKLIELHPASAYADNALYLTGLLDLKTGRLAKSLSLFNAVIEKYPKANMVPAAYLGKGLAYKRLNLNPQANEMFSKVVDAYPNSPEAIRAKREMVIVK